jgi:hypothetical protein
MTATRSTLALLAAGLLAAGTALWSCWPTGPAVPEASGLRGFVHALPPRPVVFTSRSSPASLRPQADEAEGFSWPGTIPWAANEGRLRLLTPSGRVYELTHGRELPDGGTLIDVMSPSVSLEGKRVLFAGRRAGHGHWRIYEVGIDGRGLRQLTGQPDDPGCVAVPPLRFAADGSRLPDEQRRAVDFDDVDPVDLGGGSFAFVSSRLPDLGHGHSRRATQLWTWPAEASAPFATTANRNNDRWPFLLQAGRLLFSHHTRVAEAVRADLSGVEPVIAGKKYATLTPEAWMGGVAATNAADPTYAVKSAEPVWRPRPLFNGRIAFMTPAPGRTGRLRLAQADWGYIRSAPSSLAVGSGFPDQGQARLDFWPGGDGLSAACPSPCPGGEMLLAAATLDRPEAFGLYLAPEDWEGPAPPRLLFDDPNFVDAEPVAVYVRPFPTLPQTEPPVANLSRKPKSVPLVSGRHWDGAMGYLENLAVRDAIRNPIPWDAPSASRRVDPRKDPLIPPPTAIHSVAIYASRRDRFDDPKVPRVIGGLVPVRTVPLDNAGALQDWVPSDPMSPTVLAGLDTAGKVVRCSGKAKDAKGRVASWVAFAGDHYSAARPDGYHYCNGCHAGHTFTSLGTREREGP